MKKSLTLLIIILPLILFGQKKIDQKIYLYGNVTNKISSTVLIRFAEADPKTDLKTVKYFQEKGVKAISWNNLFIPGAEYSQTEFDKTVNENNITTIIYINVTGESTANYNYSNTNAYASVYATNNYANAKGSSHTQGGSVNYTVGLGLKMDVYSIINGFEKPSGVLIGEATGDWGVASSERSIAAKILHRMLSGLESENAFK